MNRLITVILFLVLAGACLLDKDENISETEFVARAQERDADDGFLIKKVHNSKITIDYGFSDNNYCSRQFVGQFEQQLKNSISESLRVWLAPLADRGKIVNKFDYRYKKTHKDGEHRKFKHFVWGVLGGRPDMAVILYCQLGRSYTLITSHAMIHMYRQNNGRKGVTDIRKYSIGNLHHEIGHAFGLGDTYVDHSGGLINRERYNTSDGGDASIIGNQPISVMNQYYLMALDDANKLQLGNDDIAGVNWLYDYFITKTIDSDHCPPSYRYESSTKGCAPRYPLIFAVKHNIYSVVVTMLEDDSTIDINQQDRLGNTALHYAANAQGVHGTSIYQHLLGKGANADIKNIHGKSPRDLFKRRKDRRE